MKMRTKKKMAVLLAVIFVFGGIGLWVYQSKVDVSNVPVDKLNSLGNDLNEGIGVFNGKGNGAVAGTIAGKEILVETVETGATLYRYAGSETPLQDAWEALKMEALEYGFAEEHGLLPTEDEIMKFTREMREIFESDEDGRLYEETVLGAIGMTPEYYWEVYKPQVESPVHLIKINIANYCDEKGISWEETLSKMQVEDELTNQKLIEKYSAATETE